MFFILYLYVESHPDCTTGYMTPCIFYDNVAMRVFNPLSLSSHLLHIRRHVQVREIVRRGKGKRKERSGIVKNRERR